MAPPRIRKTFSGFAPDLQIDLKRPCILPYLEVSVNGPYLSDLNFKISRNYIYKLTLIAKDRLLPPSNRVAKVMFSVASFCPQEGNYYHVTTTWTCSNIFTWGTSQPPACPPHHRGTPKDKLVHLGPHCTALPYPTPHVQTCSLCSPCCWQAGSWLFG